MQEHHCDLITAFLNANLPFEKPSAALVREKIWGDPDFDPGLLVSANQNDGLSGLGMAVVRNGAGGKKGFIKFLAVDEVCRRRGIGSGILAELETGLRVRGCRQVRLGECAPNYWWPGLDKRLIMAWAFFKRRGYHVIGEALNLAVDLTGPSFKSVAFKKLKRESVCVRRAQPENLPAIRRLLAVHWPSWGAEVARAFDQHPISLHLACRNHEILGFAAYDSNNCGTGWFGPMGTAPEARGLGIGRVLLWRCLDDLRGQALARAIIPWVGPVAFYEKHARAVLDRQFIRCQKSLEPKTQ